jgi:ribosomal protein L9
VAEALRKEAKAEIDKTHIVLREPLRSLGVHTVEVRLLSDVRASVTVAIEPA